MLKEAEMQRRSQSRFRPNESSQKKPLGPIERHIEKMVEQFRRDLYEQFAGRGELMKLDQIEESACDMREKMGKAIAEEITQAQAEELEERDGV